MRRFVSSTLGIAFVLVFLAWTMGIVGFSYPHIIENQPLLNPVKVVEVARNRLVLADRRVIEIETCSGQDITNQLAQSDYMVDAQPGKDSMIGIYARRNGWVCGTPWAQPIRIPIFRDTVYENRRELIAGGRLITEDGDSQPAR